jgi:hypothetical protein
MVTYTVYKVQGSSCPVNIRLNDSRFVWKCVVSTSLHMSGDHSLLYLTIYTNPRGSMSSPC